MFDGERDCREATGDGVCAVHSSSTGYHHSATNYSSLVSGATMGLCSIRALLRTTLVVFATFTSFDASSEYSTTLRWCRCTSCESLVPSYPSMSIEFVLHHRSGFVGQSEKLPPIYACRTCGPNVPISASTRVRVEFSGYSVVLSTIGGSVTTRVVAPATYFVF